MNKKDETNHQPQYVKNVVLQPIAPSEGLMSESTLQQRRSPWGDYSYHKKCTRAPR